jgi:hypothetical protein
MQARFLWQTEAVHSIDWTYSVITSACPTDNTSMLAFEADAWSTSVSWNPNLARNWAQQAMSDGMSRDTM